MLRCSARLAGLLIAVLVLGQRPGLAQLGPPSTISPSQVWEESGQDDEEPPDGPGEGDPVDMKTGSFEFSEVDLAYSTPGPSFELRRYYRSTADGYSSYLGENWEHSYERKIVIEFDWEACEGQAVVRPNEEAQMLDWCPILVPIVFEGFVIYAPPPGYGTWPTNSLLSTATAYVYHGDTTMSRFEYDTINKKWHSPGDQDYTLTSSAFTGDAVGGAYVSQLPRQFTLRSKDGNEQVFAKADYGCGAKSFVTYKITRSRDRVGNTFLFEYEDLLGNDIGTEWPGYGMPCAGNGVKVVRLSRVWDPLGRSVEFKYTSGRLTEVEDWTGRKVNYEYDSSKRLVGVERPEMQLESGGALVRPQVNYGYFATTDRLTTVVGSNEVADGSMVPTITNTYDSKGRVTKQYFGGVNSSGIDAGGYWNFKYEDVAGQQGIDHGWFVEERRSLVCDPNGTVKLYLFDENGAARFEGTALGRLTKPEAGGGEGEPWSGTDAIDSIVNYSASDPNALSISLVAPAELPLSSFHEGGLGGLVTRRDYVFGVLQREVGPGFDREFIYAVAPTHPDEFQRTNLVAIVEHPVGPAVWGATLPDRVTAYAYEPIFNQVSAVYHPEYFEKEPGFERHVTYLTFDYQEVDLYIDEDDGSGGTVTVPNVAVLGPMGEDQLIDQLPLRLKLLELGVLPEHIRLVEFNYDLGDQNGNGVRAGERHFGMPIRIETGRTQWEDSGNSIVALSGSEGTLDVILARYNSFGRVTHRIAPDGGVTRHLYHSLEAPAGFVEATNPPPNAWGIYPAGWPTRDAQAAGEIGGGFEEAIEHAELEGGPALEAETFTRDSLGAITGRTDLRGATWSEELNAVGVVLSVSGPEGEYRENEFDHNLWRTAIRDEVSIPVPDAAGRPDPVANEVRVESIEFERDLLGRVVTHKASSGVDRFAWADEQPGGDPDWYVRRFRYDRAGNLVLKTYPTLEPDAGGMSSALETFTFDELGRKIEETVGGATSTWRSQWANARVLDPAQAGFGLPAWSDHADMTTDSYTRNGGGGVVAEADGKGQVESFAWDGFGRVMTHVQRDGISHLYYHDLHDNILWSKTYDVGTQLVQCANYVYDEQGYILEEEELILTQSGGILPWDGPTSPGDGWSTVRYQRSWTGRIEAEQADTGSVSRRAYDGLGRLIEVTDAVGNVATRAYDLAGNERRLTTVEVPAPGQSQPITRDNWRFHDLSGRVTAQTDWLGRTNRAAWDSANRQVYFSDARAGGTTVSMNTLDANGDHTDLPPSVLANQPGNSRWREFDDRGRNWKTVRQARFLGHGGGALAGQSEDIELRASFNGRGQVTARYDGKGNETEYQRDDLGRVAVESTAGETTYSATTFDLNGNVLNWTTANSVDVTQSFDSMDRLLGVSAILPSGSLVEGPLSESYSYDFAGRITSVSTGNVSTTIRYDSLGRVVEEEQSHSSLASPWLTSATYNAVSRSLEISYPSGYEVQRSWDVLGRLSEVKAGGSGQWTPLAAYEYEGFDRQVLRHTAPNGLDTEWSYGASGWLEDVDHLSANGASRLSIQTSWDNAGNRTFYRDSVSQKERSFEYDSFDRLEASTIMSGSSLLAEVYDLDKGGNRESVSGGLDPGSYSQFGAGVEPQNQIAGTPFDQRGYDDAGNLVSVAEPVAPGSSVFAPSRDLFFDFRDRLARIDVVGQQGVEHVYEYDGLGRRVYKSIGVEGGAPLESHLVWFGDQVIEERDGTGALARRFTYGSDIDEPVLMQVSSAGGSVNDYFYLTDDQYSVLVVEDELGAVQEEFCYTDYGRSLSASSYGDAPVSAIGNPFRFQGLWHDYESGYLYARGRYYEPRTGRFLTKDPVGIWSDGSALGNGYTWCGSNPWSHRDPFGTTPWKSGGGGKGGKWNCGDWSSAAKGAGSGIVQGLKDAFDLKGWLLAPFQAKESLEAIRDAVQDLRDKAEEDGLLDALGDLASDSDIGCLIAKWCCLGPKEFGEKVGGALTEAGALATGGGAAGLGAKMLKKLKKKKGRRDRDRERAQDDVNEDDKSDSHDSQDEARREREADEGKGDPSTEPPGCFVAGTVVLLADGTSCPIEEVRPGARVLAAGIKTASALVQESISQEGSYVAQFSVFGRKSGGQPVGELYRLLDEAAIAAVSASNPSCYFRSKHTCLEGWLVLQELAQSSDLSDGFGNLVVGTTKSWADTLVRISIGHCGAEVVLTPEHPVKLSGGGFVPASELRVGDSLELAAGSACVVGLCTERFHGWVYNLEVAGDHSYFVSDLGLLVHNDNAPCAKQGSAGGPGAGKSFSKSTKDRAREQADNKCVFCGVETDRKPGPNQSHIDHSISKVNGGNNSLENAQNSCRTCNLAKGAKNSDEFIDGQ